MATLDLGPRVSGVMRNVDLALMAHLMRRADFGATRDELEAYVAKGYQATVEELLNPGNSESMPDDLIRRYHVDQSELRLTESAAAYRLYKMVTAKCPLEDKFALFWHSLFATGNRKVNQAKTMLAQTEKYRRHGLGSFRSLLVQGNG